MTREMQAQYIIYQSTEQGTTCLTGGSSLVCVCAVLCALCVHSLLCRVRSVYAPCCVVCRLCTLCCAVRVLCLLCVVLCALCVRPVLCCARTGYALCCAVYTVCSFCMLGTGANKEQARAKRKRRRWCTKAAHRG